MWALCLGQVSCTQETGQRSLRVQSRHQLLLPASVPPGDSHPPLPSRLALNACPWVWFTVGSPSSGWARSQAQFHPRAATGVCSASLRAVGCVPTAACRCGGLTGPRPFVLCRAEGPPPWPPAPIAATVLPGLPRARCAQLLQHTQAESSVVLFFPTIDLVL